MHSSVVPAEWVAPSTNPWFTLSTKAVWCCRCCMCRTNRRSVAAQGISGVTAIWLDMCVATCMDRSCVVIKVLCTVFSLQRHADTFT